MVRRGLAAALLATMPLMVALGVELFVTFSSSAYVAVIDGILSEHVVISGYTLPLSLLCQVAILVLTMCFGYLSIDYYFIRHLRAMRVWIGTAEATSYERLDVLPDFGRDELGDLGRTVLSVTTQVSHMRSENNLLLQEKSLFMTIAAHQLRTPLTGLLWSIDALLDPSTDEEHRKGLMTDVDGLLKRMRLIVNHILASANVEGGRFGYAFEQIDIVPVIAKLLEEFKPLSDLHQVTMHFEHARDVAMVVADRERISLALFDLISNAIDYTPAGGSVTVSLAPSQDRFEVAVSDTGIGISESELPHLFSKFYRSDRARHVRPDGSGLGLFLVKDIVSSHGSQIEVASKEGAGSRFSFFLNSKKV